MDIQVRTLRFANLPISDSFTLDKGWRFVSICAAGSGVITLANLEGESIEITEDVAYNQYLPSESFDEITISSDANTTAIITWFK